MPRRILFHIGGPAFHPVDQQSRQIIDWIGPDFSCASYDGVDAFDHLDDADLLVLMGLHWTGLTPDWSGLFYRPMMDSHKRAFESYISSGRPLLTHHGAIASYDDWPRFGELIGFTWIWNETTHSPVQNHRVHITNRDHPITHDLTDFDIHDELYYRIKITPGTEPQTLATATWENHQHPMIMITQGGRTSGAGTSVYLANGHDMKAFESPSIRQLWINSINFLLR
jgi:type 1 glutamine amidotransferase